MSTGEYLISLVKPLLDLKISKNIYFLWNKLRKYLKLVSIFLGITKIVLLDILTMLNSFIWKQLNCHHIRNTDLVNQFYMN